MVDISNYPKVIKVENPKFQTTDEMVRDYVGYWILISNHSDNPMGGIVRYYSPKKYDGLWEIIMELDKDDEMYGGCLVQGLIPNDGSYGRLG